MYNLHRCYTFCTGVTLFALVLHLNCTALSQSESSNFFVCIISGAPAARRVAGRSPIIIEKGTTRMHRNRNPCNSFLLVKMASGMDHGRVRPTTTTTNDVAQHGGHPANTKPCSLGLQHISLILDMHIMCN